MPGLALSLGLCFMLFIYAPYELFITNRDDFWFTAGQLLSYCAGLFAVGLLLCTAAFLTARKIGNKLVVFGTALLFWLLISCYVQGNFLVSGLPGLDGSIIDWNAYPAERLKSILCWGIGAALTAALVWILGSRRFNTIASILGAGLTLMLAITLALLAITGNVQRKETLAATDEYLMTMSDTENMIILHLDAVDACEFEKLIAEDPSFKNDFSDFTYFDNAMGGYPSTKCSTALILSGQWFEAQKNYDEFINEALSAAPLFRALESSNYRMGLYYNGDYFLQKGLYDGRIENLADDEPVIGSAKEMAVMVLRMAAVKYAPWELKSPGYNLQRRLETFRVFKNGEGLKYYDWSNSLFYARLMQPKAIELRSDKTFKYITVEGAHNPFVYNENVEISPDATYSSCIAASVTISRQLIKDMKEAGVYDNSVIVLMADHGYNPMYDETNMHQHPILMIKGRGEQHEFRTDNAPISYADLQDAFVKLLDGADSSECFDWHEGDARERRFLDYDWRDLTYFEEYIQTGQAEDMDSLKATGRIYGD